MPSYRLHDTHANDLGILEHPAPNLEPGDVILLEDGREALITGRVKTPTGHPVTAMLEVVVTELPESPVIELGFRLSRSTGSQSNSPAARPTIGETGAGGTRSSGGGRAPDHPPLHVEIGMSGELRAATRAEGTVSSTVLEDGHEAAYRGGCLATRTLKAADLVAKTAQLLSDDLVIFHGPEMIR